MRKLPAVNWIAFATLEHVAIPPFNIDGVLPPYVGDGPGDDGAFASPYEVELVDLFERFARTDPRKKIAKGLLDYRAALRAAGVVGVQWIDGSFVEDVESVRRRPPNDVDVLTIIAPSNASAVNALAGTQRDLFVPSKMKERFRCDAHWVVMDPAVGTGVAKYLAYWMNLFSHQRDSFAWKGILQVLLDNVDDDSAAVEVLSRDEATP